MVSEIIKKIKNNNIVVCIVGVGYVGYPLVQAFSRYFKTIGYDFDDVKIKILNKESINDNTYFTTDPRALSEADVIIVCVPTPVTDSKMPDLSYVKSAAKTIGKYLKKGSIVVYESTYYPGVTEEIVIPILEAESGLKGGTHFKVGYSPERINPGDNKHTIKNVVKIVSGIDEETSNILATLYEKIAPIYITSNIKTAEAAKVIENIQRDLNIALINELTLIMHRMNLDTKEVLDAASTKWNFHRYEPGLVGGHCIPVDPYYLVYKAQELDYHPQVILAGRTINDAMPKYVSEITIKGLIDAEKLIKGSRVLIMGLTYKENVQDTRESPSKDIITELNHYGIEIYGYDPLLTEEEIEEFGVKLYKKYDGTKFDAIIVAVKHKQFLDLNIIEIKSMMNKRAVLIDVKGIYDQKEAKHQAIYYKKL